MSKKPETKPFSAMQTFLLLFPIFIQKCITRLIDDGGHRTFCSQSKAILNKRELKNELASF